MTRAVRRALLLALLPIVGLAALVPAADAAECWVLSGGEVFVDGAFTADASVVVADGRVAAVGVGVTRAGCEVVDVRGKVVTPGLVDVASQVGLAEVDAESATVDTDLEGPFQGEDHLVRASVRPWLAFDPRASAIGVTRLGGVTSAGVWPSGGIVSGQAFWADLTGGDQATSIRRAPIAMIAKVGGGGASRARAFHLLDVALTEAAWLRRHRAAFERGQTRALLLPFVELDAMAPLLDRAVPLVVAADRASDIEAALGLARTHGVSLVIAGGAEAWLVASQLAAARVPVVVDPLVYGPGSFDQIHARADNAALLAAANVPVAISTFSSHSGRKLRQLAGNAVRGGLTREAALTAITRAPADAMGMPEHGRLAAGAVANVAVWSGDPLELSTRLERLWVQGVDVPLVSRQTRLRDRYRKLPVAAPGTRE